MHAIFLMSLWPALLPAAASPAAPPRAPDGVEVPVVAVPAGPAAPAALPVVPRPARLPVKEVTVFKDGHAFVLHEGTVPLTAGGEAVLDHLPQPVLGTFWPYTSDKAVRLRSVTAGRHVVTVERTAMNVRELLEANPGAEVVVTEGTGHPYPATVVGFLIRSAAEHAASAPAGSDPVPAQKSDLVQLRTAEGVKVVDVARITELKFTGRYRTTLPVEENRHLLTLRLDPAAAGGAMPPRASVGMAYLQKGIRWIPHYRVELDGNGKAVVRMHATLLNELTDLEDVTLHMVVGVPTFAFKDSLDPVSLSHQLQGATARLSQYFETDSRQHQMLSNAMMTQVARGGEHFGPRGRPVENAGPDLGPDAPEGARNEDLFVYTLKGVTLRKGARMVVPVSERTLDYRDVFTLDLPFAPPPDVRRHGNSDQAAELARLLAQPKVMHAVRLTNKGGQPLTTAPALLLKEGRVLAQGMMTYTPAGAEVDLPVTAAVDLKVRKTDRETKRTPNVANWHGEILQRIDLAGSVRLVNHKDKAVEVEVVRHVLGNVGTADNAGRTEMVNVFEDDGYVAGGAAAHPHWWGWYSWPGWWSHYNGVGRIRWTVKLEPGKPVDLGYTWNYYWR